MQSKSSLTQKSEASAAEFAATPRAAPSAAQALEQHHQELQVYLKEWGLSLESLVTELLADPAAAAAARRPLEQGPALAQLEATPDPDAIVDSTLDSAGVEQQARPPVGSTRIGIAREATSISASFFKADQHQARILGLGSNENSLARNCMEKLDLLIMEPTKPRKGACKCLTLAVASSPFEALSALIILANAIYIAYASDHEIGRVLHGGSALPREIELTFTLWYTMELLLRLYVYGPRFYACEDWKWNVFDTVLVLFSVQDLLGSAGQTSPSFLRVMRLARMMKLLRVIRLMRMFRELRLILNSILGCMKSMFWAAILIMNVSFIFGLCFLQAITEHLKDEGDSIDPTSKDELLLHWGNVGLSMYSLYAAALGGLDWEVQANSLRKVGIMFWLLYLLYVGFFFCVITNTLTSLFVEATIINAERDKDQIIQDELEHKELYVDKLKKLFTKIGGGRGESLGLDKFLEHLEDPEMIYFAATLGIEVVDLREFFTILSQGGEQVVDVESFVVGCIKLKGTAKSMDLMDMKISLKRENAELRKQVKAIGQRVDNIANSVRVEKPRDLRNKEREETIGVDPVPLNQG